MKENWQQENLEKTKKVLTEHFERKKEEEMFKEMCKEMLSSSTPIQLHVGTNWDVESSEFDEIKDDFIDDFIREDLTDSNNKKENKSDKGSE